MKMKFFPKETLFSATLVVFATLCSVMPARGQYSSPMGVATGQGSASGQLPGVSASVPTGSATNDVLRLTLRDAINSALRYNLASIESGENTRIARGQKLVALSQLLPQINVGASEHVEQVNLDTLGLKVPGIPTIVGPFSYSSADVNVSTTLFSFESIQRFRAARTAEEAAMLSYQDVLDVVTLTVGNAYLQIIEADSRIQAQAAQVQNAKALYDQARDQLQAGTSPRIEVTRTEVQLHTEEYSLSVARNHYAIAKLNLSRAIGLPVGQQFELEDQIPYSGIAPTTLEDALKMAYKSRSDFRAALSSEKAARESVIR